MASTNLVLDDHDTIEATTDAKNYCDSNPVLCNI